MICSLLTTALALSAGCGETGSPESAGADWNETSAPEAAPTSALTCELYDPDDAAWITSGDTGARKLAGEVLSSVQVRSGMVSAVGKEIVFLAINVGGTVLRLAFEDGGLYVSLDDLTESVTSFPQLSAKFGIDPSSPAAALAAECAGSGQMPTTTAPPSGFNVEAWRQIAISRFGPEQTFDDGSKDDYVQSATSLCQATDEEKADRKRTLGNRYEGSFQQFVDQTFCPSF